MFDARPSGLLNVEGELPLGHAVVYVGFSRSRSLDGYRGPLFGGLNSWGAGWGVNGRFYATMDHMDRFYAEGAEAAMMMPVAA